MIGLWHRPVLAVLGVLAACHRPAFSAFSAFAGIGLSLPFGRGG